MQSASLVIQGNRAPPASGSSNLSESTVEPVDDANCPWIGYADNVGGYADER